MYSVSLLPIFKPFLRVESVKYKAHYNYDQDKAVTSGEWMKLVFNMKQWAFLNVFFICILFNY